MDHNQLGRKNTHRHGCEGMFYLLGVIVAEGAMTHPPDGLRQEEKKYITHEILKDVP